MGDQFDQANFDPISYLNNHFPDEQSLIGLDNEIQKLNNQLTNVNKQLIQQIHQHAMINIQISDQIKKAKILSKQIISEISIIKDKAKKSQQIVYDMCKDLKSLDIAKKNLTFSIDALKKFIMMVDALQKLRQSCQNKQYLEVANLLSAFNQLSNHFKKYQQIPQIQDLYKQKNAIVEELYAQLTQDFQQFYQGPTHLTEKNMEAAAKVIQGLGQEYWLKFSKWINHMILKQYEQQYDTPQALVLQNTQRRYGFIKRKMQDFSTKFGHIIPIEWGADCRLLYEFCSVTRLHLTKTLQKTSHNVNIAILMKSMQFSIKFENKITQLMFKKYQQLLKRKNKQQNDLQLIPKFIGSISNSFQPYLKPYIKSQQDSLLQALKKSIEQDKLTQIKVYNSSIVLFHGIKNSIRRANSYSKGNLMLEILFVVKKILKIYSQKCFEKNKKNQQHFQENICWIINTAQYCKSMIQGVQQCFESSIDPNRGQNIDFSNQNELFSNLISKSIELFITTLDIKLELILNTIHKTQWQKMTQMDVDISSYVRQLKQLLLNNFLKIKDQLESLYLTLYLDKIVVLTANKFIQNIYKCKKLNSQAFLVLHIDITQIKVILLDLVKTDKRTYSNPKTMQKYTTFVNKTFIKGQNMIKLMKLDNEQFAQKFEILMQGVGVAQLEKMLQVKGAKKSDFPHLVQSLENKNL